MMAFSAVEGNGGVPLPVGLSGVNFDEWLSENLNVAVCSFFLFLLVQGIGGFRAKVEWVALVHSIITGVGSIHCIYLDQFHAETMTGTFGASVSCPYDSIWFIPFLFGIVLFVMIHNPDFNNKFLNLWFCKIAMQTLFE